MTVTEQAKESISVLMDEEISEIELHRLLRQFGEDSSLKESWISYQQMRAVMRREYLLSIHRHVELHNRISAAIESDETVFTPSSGSRKPLQWRKPAAGFAVAASIVAAVLVGFNSTRQPSLQASSAQESSAQQSSIQQSSIQQSSIQQSSVSVVQETGSAPVQPAFLADSELHELDPDRQRRLRQYLNQHERNVRMNSNTRTVTYKRPPSKD